MGVVYRARDPRLGREVAIKLIPETFAADASRLHRFELEARAAGQLNHPNILAVYDVGTHDGAPFLVSELLEGESLRDRLQGGALPSRKAIDCARQIAEGLAAAHAKGIVHRDLKPDNLFITSDGRVKILDFGIAKLTRASDDAAGLTGSPTETEPGMVVGTAGYMSPEQVRGEAVDPRSDLFSVGAILYEMLTGRPSFSRGTTADTMAAVLKEDPPAPLRSDVPALDRIVARCLEKSREARFQSARDLAFALEVLSGPSPGQAAAVAASRRQPVAWAIAAVAIAFVAAVAIWLSRDTAPAPVDNPLVNARFSRVTDWEGTEAGGAISPDGRFVAFIADRDGQLDLWVSQLGTGRFLNLTQDIPPLSAPGFLRTFGFSGDGGEIWFTQAGDSSAPKSLIPLTGGTPRPFLGQGAATPSWSPDAGRLAYFINEGGDPFYLADRTGADAQPLVVDKEGFFAGSMHNHNPVWSSDGQWIYFAHGPEPNQEMNVWRVRPSGGTPEQLTTLHTAANLLAPIAPRTLLYIARAEDQSGPWLWSLDVETKVSRRVTSGLEHYSSVSASRDGRRVVASVADPKASLWRVPLLDRQPEDRDVQPYPVPSARALAPRFGGTSMFYLSASGAGDGLWRFQDGKASEVWKAEDDSLTEPPAVSPDGGRVAIVVRQLGKPRLSVMTADGTNARTLATSIEIQGAGGQGSADWSPDGAWIVAAGKDEQGSGLFKIPVDGGAPVRLVSGQFVNPVWSPDGALIVYGGPVVGGQVPLLGVRPDGTPVEWPELRVRIDGGYRFLPSGTGLVYLPRGQSLDFWLFDLATRASRPLTHLGDHGRLGTFDITPDGKAIVFDRSRENSDIVLIDLPD